MNMLTHEDTLNKLHELATKARVNRSWLCSVSTHTEQESGTLYFAAARRHPFEDSSRAEADADFIRACDPWTIMKMVEEIEQARDQSKGPRGSRWNIIKHCERVSGFLFKDEKGGLKVKLFDRVYSSSLDIEIVLEEIAILARRMKEVGQ